VPGEGPQGQLIGELGQNPPPLTSHSHIVFAYLFCPHRLGDDLMPGVQIVS